MITLRARIFIIASLAVLIILGISIALIVIKKKSVEPVDETPTTPANIIDETSFPAQIISPATPIPEGATVKIPTTEEMLENAAKQTARIFTERYGTYSTDNEYENIYAVQTIVTPEYWQEISRHIGSPTDGEFIGVTTKVMTINVQDFQTNQAKVNMTVQRAITKGQSTERISEQVVVRLVRVNDTWLVSGIE